MSRKPPTIRPPRLTASELRSMAQIVNEYGVTLEARAGEQGFIYQVAPQAERIIPASNDDFDARFADFCGK